jgi:YHS domain-containing protein
MKRRNYFLVAAAGILAVAALVAGCRSEPTSAPPKKEGGGAVAAPAAGAAEIAQKICPVMGNPIDPNIYVDYNGRRIYFCCNMCPETFKKDPEKYIAKLNEQMKTGAPATK